MTRPLLTLILALCASNAMAETIIITGQNGATYHGTRSCVRASGQISCDSTGTVTTPTGATGTRARASTLTQGTLTSTLTGTRANGRSFGRTTTITR